MKTEILSFKDYRNIKDIVKNDGVVAFPTETVYGLGIRYDSFLAYEKIFEIKNREAKKTLTLMLSDKNEIKEYALIDEKVEKVIDRFMPGALTLVLPLKEDKEIIGCQKTIGIRIPDSKETIDLLKYIEIPMFVTSANISGQPSFLTFEQVFNQFNKKIDAIVNGEVGEGQASTVVSILDGVIKVLRDGPISLSQIKEVYES